ncbi:MAG: 2,3-diphosphoglycerate-dependent phosphoglycerate mutase [Bacteroidales bacterium]|jgi:2,3-bisphosphoglycerate-dependent phosphoglycerate mutase|nr:2,3-diphosphoglycerate-dependent phosphoglycerate mutase [Bacteroidales bacterium]OQA84821.1 MAG: 2,3-bisphosphoglycerate-dependent phosphoglycerate mutase [Bacteroidetes bacterium ADurb.Bin234]
MYRLVLLRHGESEWNKENRFTGWTDVDLSERGIKEAIQAGKTMKEKGFVFQYAYTSYLKRAIKTLVYSMEEMDQLWIPVEKTWRLNEKHYGFLQGLNKKETVDKYGEEKVLLWRRSFNIAPPPLPESDPRHPVNDIKYKYINEEGATPGTESLSDTINRIMPYWHQEIIPRLKKHKEIIISAHGNSLRAIVKHVKQITDEDIITLNLPTGIPYVFEFDEDINLLNDYFLADEATLKALMDEVANQTKK